MRMIDRQHFKIKENPQEKSVPGYLFCGADANKRANSTNGNGQDEMCRSCTVLSRKRNLTFHVVRRFQYFGNINEHR